MNASLRNRRHWLTGVGVLASACLLTACASSLDLERARRMLSRPTPRALPVALQSGPATGALPAPEGLRATSGELRMVPLKWDPVLTGTIGGYVIERSQHQEGPFERLTTVAGALTTTYLDRIESDSLASTVEVAAHDDPPSEEVEALTASSDGVDVATASLATLPTEEVEAAPAASTSVDGATASLAALPTEEVEAAPAASTSVDVAAAPTTIPETAEPEVEAFEAGLAHLELDADEPETSSLDGVTFFYRVRTFSPTGEVSTSASRVVGASTAPPPRAPEDLRAYSHQPRKVPLSWRTSTDPTVAGYRVDRSPTSLGPFEVVAQLDGRHSTTYVDEGLGDLRVFYYRVAALNAAGGNGALTEPVRAVTKPEPLPPLGLRVLDLRLGENHLAWEPNVEPDIAEYRLFRQREGSAAQELVDTVPHGSFEARDPVVGADEKVVYTLVAFDEDGLESSPSDPIAVESEGYDLRGSVGPEGVRLEWNPRKDEGFRGARIFRGGILSQREFPPVAGSSFIDRDVKPGRSYRYSVALIDGAGSTAPRSAPLEIRVPSE